MHEAWIASWPRTDRNKAGWKMDGRGRTSERVSTGRAKEKAIDAIERSTPEASNCVSEDRDPSNESTESEYAEMRQCSIKICCC
eukprot:scaffold127738_cov30-Tisochrysis_lutea.AAC.1